MSAAFLTLALPKEVSATPALRGAHFSFASSSFPAPFPLQGTLTIPIPGDGTYLCNSPDPVQSALYARLIGVPGVDGAYIQEPGGDVAEDGITVNVLAREHGVVDRETLLEIEDALADQFSFPFTLIIRAHQGRDMRSLAGPNLLFARRA
jgi:hypothetical protein